MPKTLLLADDSVTIQKVVGISFANEDVVLLTVDNGDDAVARAREVRPDLVLADVLMPGLDGYEVCEALKADPELRHVPVLLLSGTFESFDEDRARRAGADGHITKPFEAQALVDQVNELLARSEAARAAAAPPGDATILVSEPADGGDAFDFLDEEMGQTAPAPAVAPTVLVEPHDDDEAAFPLEATVEDELDEVDLAPESIAVLAAPADDEAPDARATVLFEDEAGSLQALTDPFAGAPDAGLGRYEESFDFGLEEAAVEASTGAAGTVLGAAPGLAAEPLAALEAPSYAESPDLESEPFELGDPIDDEGLAAGDLRPETISAPRFEAVPPPVPREARVAPEVAAPVPPAPPAAMGGARPALSPELAAPIQQALEKIAWEAFGDLSERIVRESLARVEAIAWEVIPQMAETLIREEIRRLKESE